MTTILKNDQVVTLDLIEPILNDLGIGEESTLKELDPRAATSLYCIKLVKQKEAEFTVSEVSTMALSLAKGYQAGAFYVIDHLSRQLRKY